MPWWEAFADAVRWCVFSACAGETAAGDNESAASTKRVKNLRHTWKCAENREPFQCSPARAPHLVSGGVRDCPITGDRPEGNQTQCAQNSEPHGIGIRTVGSIPKRQRSGQPDSAGAMAAAMGQKDGARKAWEAAIASARQMAPDAQKGYIPSLESKLQKL